MHEECSDLTQLGNPFDEQVDHQDDIAMILSPGTIKDISYQPPQYHRDFIVDYTYFGLAISGRLPDI